MRLVLFRESDGSVPLLDWLGEIPLKAAAKCRVRLERLAELGHELRRPEADLLRDGIHELRASHLGVNYRVLYFFYRNIAAVVSHGITKESAVPAREIELAIRRKAAFQRDPARHTAADSRGEN
jgi:phage-related protein